LTVFSQKKLKENIIEGIEAANARAVELGT